MSSVQWVVADIFLVSDSGQEKIEPLHQHLKYSSDISMEKDTIWGMWKRHAKKMWMSHMLVCDYLLFSLCLISVYMHVLTCMCNAFLLSVCHCHKIGDKPAINEKGSTHYRVPHFGGSFIIWRTSERANLFETPALNCTTKTKLQPFISDMIRLAYDSNISSLDILGSSGAGYLVGGPLFWPAVKKLT